MKIDRLMSITIYLLKHGRTSAAKLAEHFEVNPRTIIRDMDTLCQAGIPISSTYGVNGGYEILDTYVMDKQLVNHHDYKYIVSALKTMASAYENTKIQNEKVEIAKFILNELDRFESVEGKASLDYAQIIYSEGLDGFLDAPIPTMQDVANMKPNTAEEKALRKNIVSLIRDLDDARKTAAKYFQNGIKEFDTSVIDKLYDEENQLEAKLFDLTKEMKSAKENGETDKFAPIREKTEACRKEKENILKQIKEATKEYSNYRRAAKPYLDAVKTVTQAENYRCLDTIEALYREKTKNVE